MTDTDRQPVTPAMAELLDRCTASCQLLAEQVEGPYRRGSQPGRRDITEGTLGTPLGIGLKLRHADGSPLAAAEVEIWHCDAGGRYSGYPPPRAGAEIDSTPQRAEYLPEQTFLRGSQRTDDAGNVEFRSIYPGWYLGRTVHVHVVAHTPDGTLTSQLYFPEDITAAVFARQPYSDRGLPDTTNATDTIFPTGGEPAVLEIADDRGDATSDGATSGYRGVICLVLPRG